ncbi:hypothetical protein [Eremococcus coleocola]|uniref:hypothetical protein n=1 Tax=Eremococcus coleocola TaxID=88132 RepID=UPI000425BD76|nr:hypothetical protein [Eremococcus coleocola]
MVKKGLQIAQILNLLIFLSLVPLVHGQTQLSDEDLIAPIIYAPARIFDKNQSYNLLEDVIAVDNSDQILEVHVLNYDQPAHVSFENYQTGIYFIEYMTQDEAGNIGRLIRPIYVKDVSEKVDLSAVDLGSPDLKTEPVTIKVGDYTSLASFQSDHRNVSAIDQEDGDITEMMGLTQDSLNSLNIFQPGRYLVEWYVVDQANNPAYCQQWVIVE